MPARHLSATAQANILQNILQQAGVEVLQRTVKELFVETGMVARSVYTAFAAYSLAVDRYNNSQRDIAGILRRSDRDHVYHGWREDRKRRDATLVQG